MVGRIHARMRKKRFHGCMNLGVEMVRKVIGHALTKPTREILFTVLTRQEKWVARWGGGRRHSMC